MLTHASGQMSVCLTNIDGITSRTIKFRNVTILVKSPLDTLKSLRETIAFSAFPISRLDEPPSRHPDAILKVGGQNFQMGSMSNGTLRGYFVLK